jgi:hypothetical protein
MDDPGAADDFSFLDGFEARPQGHSIQSGSMPKTPRAISGRVRAA